MSVYYQCVTSVLSDADISNQSDVSVLSVRCQSVVSVLSETCFHKGSGFIIQWNCRGLSANRQELELLAQEYKAPVICLQETNLND